MSFLLLFLIVPSVFTEFPSSANRSAEICSNGAVPGGSCQLVPSSGFECRSSNSSASWCESFNGTYKCCEKSVKKCTDRSSFCKLTRHLCRSKSEFRTMKSKCEATCGFCGIESYEEAERVEKRMNELARGQECDLPRKCVYPKEKMLNATTPNFSSNFTSNSTSTTTTKTLVIDPIIAYRAKLNWNKNESTTESQNTTSTGEQFEEKSTKVDLETLLQTTTARLEPSKPRKPISTVDPNESLKTFAASRSSNISTTLTLPKSFNTSTTARKLTLDDLKSTRDTMPKITTAEPSSLTTSLSKTVIQGTCFDEYTYCREFTSLCSHPAFSEVMASHCSLSCDRCDEVERVEEGKEDCLDMTPECNDYRDLCEHSRYKTLMKNYCPKACGHCIPLCRDRHQNCPQFFDDGFCNDTMYTREERKYLCGATCLMC